jgi:integrase
MFGNFAKVKTLSSITASQIRRWVNKDENVNLNSRKQRLAALRSLFSYAVANSYVIKDPTAEVAVDASKLSHKQKETKSRIPFTKTEFNLLCKELRGREDPFYYCSVMLGWWTGLRIIDISKLEWDSWSDSHLTVWTEKQDKRVQLPLDHPDIGGGALRDMLGLVGHRSKKYLFPDWAECSTDPRRRSKFSVNFRRLLLSLEIKGKSFHCLRHTFVTRLSKNGYRDYDLNLDKIANWVGHSDVKTTKGYLHA